MSAAAGCLCDMRRLKKRAQFIKASRGRRAQSRAFVLQAVPANEDEPGVGFTVTKRTGNSPERNRIKRRLRAAVRMCEERFQPRHDYVLIGRRAALSEPFDALVEGLETSIARVHAAMPAKAAHETNAQDQRTRRP